MFAQIQSYLRSLSKKDGRLHRSRDGQSRDEVTPRTTSKQHNHTTTTVDKTSHMSNRVLSSGRQANAKGPTQMNNMKNSKQLQHNQSQQQIYSHHHRSITMAASKFNENLESEELPAKHAIKAVSRQYMKNTITNSPSYQNLSNLDNLKTLNNSHSLFCQNARSAAHLREITKMQGISNNKSTSVAQTEISAHCQHQLLKSQIQAHMASLNVSSSHQNQGAFKITSKSNNEHMQINHSKNEELGGQVTTKQSHPGDQYISLDLRNQVDSSPSRPIHNQRPTDSLMTKNLHSLSTSRIIIQQQSQAIHAAPSRNIYPTLSKNQSQASQMLSQSKSHMFPSSEKKGNNTKGASGGKKHQQKVIHQNKSGDKRHFQIYADDDLGRIAKYQFSIKVSDEIDEDEVRGDDWPLYLEARSPNQISISGGNQKAQLTQLPYNSNKQREMMVASKSNFTISKQRPKRPFEDEFEDSDFAQRLLMEGVDQQVTGLKLNLKGSASVNKIHSQKGGAKLNYSQSTSSMIPMSFMKQQHPDSVKSSKDGGNQILSWKNQANQWGAGGGFAAAISRVIAETPAHEMSQSPNQFDYSSNKSTDQTHPYIQRNQASVEQFSLLLDQQSHIDTQRLPLSSLEKPYTMPDSTASKHTSTSIAKLQSNYYNLKQSKRGSEDKPSASQQADLSRSNINSHVPASQSSKNSYIEFKAKSKDKAKPSQQVGYKQTKPQSQQPLSKQQQYAVQQKEKAEVQRRLEYMKRNLNRELQVPFNQVTNELSSCYSPKMQKSLKIGKSIDLKKKSSNKIDNKAASKNQTVVDSGAAVTTSRNIVTLGGIYNVDPINNKESRFKNFEEIYESDDSRCRRKDDANDSINDLNIKTTEEDIYKQYLNQGGNSPEKVNDRMSLIKTVIQQPFEYELGSSVREGFPEASEAIRAFQQQNIQNLSQNNSRLGREKASIQPTPTQLLSNVKFNTSESANYNFISSKAASQISKPRILEHPENQQVAPSRLAKSSMNHNDQEVFQRLEKRQRTKDEITKIDVDGSLLAKDRSHSSFDQFLLDQERKSSDVDFDSKRTMVLNPSLQILQLKGQKPLHQSPDKSDMPFHDRKLIQKADRIDSAFSSRDIPLLPNQVTIDFQVKNPCGMSIIAQTQRTQVANNKPSLNQRKQSNAKVKQSSLQKNGTTGVKNEVSEGRRQIQQKQKIQSPQKVQAKSKNQQKQQQKQNFGIEKQINQKISSTQEKASRLEQSQIHLDQGDSHQTQVVLLNLSKKSSEQSSFNKQEGMKMQTKTQNHNYIKSQRQTGRRKQLSQQYSSVKHNKIDNSLQLEIAPTLDRDMTYESERSSIFNENVGNFESHNRNNLLNQYNNPGPEETSRKQPHDVHDIIQQMAANDSMLSAGISPGVTVNTSRLQRLEDLNQVRKRDTSNNVNRQAQGQTSQGFTFDQHIDNPSKLLQKHLELNMRMQSLSTLEDSMLSQHQFLRCLDLRNNHLHTLPATFCSLSLLWKLRLDFNSLTELPREFGRLERLEVLTLSNNKLRELPKGLFKQGSKLGMLQINDNMLCRLPDEIGKLRRLRVLLVHNNKLKRLPSELHSLKELQELSSEWFAYMNPPQNKILKDEKGVKIIRDFQKFCKQLSDLKKKRSVQIRFVHFVAYFNKLKSVDQLTSMQTYPKQRTILHYLCLYGNLHLMKDVVRAVGQQALNFNLSDADGTTPLILAFKNKQNQIINHLLKFPALNLNKGCQKYGYPLHSAIKHHDFKIVLKMLKPQYVVNINVKDEEQNNALHFLMSQFSYDSQAAAKVGAILLRKGIEVNALNKAEFTPIHVAIKTFQNKSLKFALEYNHYLRKKQSQSTLPFDEARIKDKTQNQQQQLSLLGQLSPRSALGYTPFDFSLGGKNGWTPLHFAVFNNNLIAVELLLNSQAQKERVDVFARDREGKLPQELCPFNSSIYKMVVKRQLLVIKQMAQGWWSWDPQNYGFINDLEREEASQQRMVKRDRSNDRLAPASSMNQLQIVQEKLRKINSQASLGGLAGGFGQRRGSTGLLHNDHITNLLQHNNISRYFRKRQRAAQHSNHNLLQPQKSPRSQILTAMGSQVNLISLNEKIYQQFVISQSNGGNTGGDRQPSEVPYRPNLHQNTHNKMKRASSNGMLAMSFGGGQEHSIKHDLEDSKVSYPMQEVRSLERTTTGQVKQDVKSEIKSLMQLSKVDLKNLNFGAQEGSDDESSLSRPLGSKNPNFSLQEGISLPDSFSHQGQTVTSVKNQIASSLVKHTKDRVLQTQVKSNGKMQTSKTEKNLFGGHLSFMRYPDFGQAINLGNLRNVQDSAYNSRDGYSKDGDATTRVMITGQPRIFMNQPFPAKNNLPFEEDSQDFQQEIEEQFDPDLMKTQQLASNHHHGLPLRSSKQRKDLQYPKRATLIEDERGSPLRYMSHPVNFDTDNLVDAAAEGNLLYDSSDGQESPKTSQTSSDNESKEDIDLDSAAIQIKEGRDHQMLRDYGKDMKIFENPYNDPKNGQKASMLDQYSQRLPHTKNKIALNSQAVHQKKGQPPFAQILHQSRSLKSSRANEMSGGMSGLTSTLGLGLGNVSGNVSGVGVNDVSSNSQLNFRGQQSDMDSIDTIQNQFEQSQQERVVHIHRNEEAQQQQTEEGDEFCDADDEDAEAGSLGLIANKINKFENHNQETQSVIPALEPKLTELEAIQIFLTDLKSHETKLKSSQLLRSNNSQKLNSNQDQVVTYNKQLVNQEQLELILQNTQGVSESAFQLIGDTFQHHSKGHTKAQRLGQGQGQRETFLDEVFLQEVKVQLVNEPEELKIREQVEEANSDGNVYDTNDQFDDELIPKGGVGLDMGQTSLLFIDDGLTKLDEQYQKMTNRNIKTKTNLFLMSDSHHTQTPKSQQLSATYKRKSIVHQNRQFELTGEFLEGTLGSGQLTSLKSSKMIEKNGASQFYDSNGFGQKLTLESCLAILNDSNQPISAKYKTFYTYIFQNGSYGSDYKRLKYLFDKIEDVQINQILRVDLSYLMSVTKNKEFIPQLDKTIKAFQKQGAVDQANEKVASLKESSRANAKSPEPKDLLNDPKAAQNCSETKSHLKEKYPQSNCKKLMIYETANAFDILMQDAILQSKLMMEENNQHIHLERQRSREKLLKSKYTQQTNVSSSSKLQTSNSLYFQHQDQSQRTLQGGGMMMRGLASKQGVNVTSAAQLGSGPVKAKELKNQNVLNCDQVGKLVKLKIENLREQYTQSIISEKDVPDFLIQRIHKSPSNQSIKNLKNAFSSKRIDLSDDNQAQRGKPVSSNHSTLQQQHKVQILDQSSSTVLGQVVSNKDPASQIKRSIQSKKSS